MRKNIVITGAGIVSAIGCSKEEVTRSLLERRTGIGEMQYLESVHHELPVGEVKMSSEEMKRRLGIDAAKEVSRTVLMGMMAAEQALKEARLERKDGRRILLVSGTTVGGMDLTERHYGSFFESDEHLGCMKTHDCGSSTQQIARRFRLFDDSTTLSTACSSSANALMLGARLIESGQADIVVAGGTEALTRFHLNGFNALMILDREQCRPFDATRAGLNLGEGAAYVVLESETAARERGAEIQAWLSGSGNACDAFHQTASSDNGEGACLAMKQALEEAGLSPKDIDYVNAHIWPYNWNWAKQDSLKENIQRSCDNSGEYLKEHVRIAQKLQKPLVIEEFGYPRDGFQFGCATPTTARDEYYDYIFSMAMGDSTVRGCNFWGWGGEARPVHEQWQVGDPYCGDPAQEAQGLNSVFDCDSSTLQIIRKHNGK